MYRLPADAVEPEFAELLRYWDSRRRGDRLPARAEIEPLELRRLLPHLLLLDVERAGDRLRFRFRVAGTAFTSLIGRDVTGLHVDELGPPDRVTPVQDGLAAIVRTGRPCFLASRPTLHNDRFARVKRLGVPLATDGRAVDMILAVWLVLPQPGGTEPDPEIGGGAPILLEEC
jgi:hypothetical protein